MRSSRPFALAAAALAIAGCGEKVAARPELAVVRIEYVTNLGYYITPGDSVGTGFFARRPSGVALVTPYHIFSTHAPAPDSLDRYLTEVTGASIMDARNRITADRGFIPIANVVPASLTDLAAFHISALVSASLPLAEQDAAPGDTVTLIARLHDPQAGRLRHVAVVDTMGRAAFRDPSLGLASVDGFMIVRFEDQQLHHAAGGLQLPRLARTNGAPVVNRRDEVVGMMLGETMDRTGRGWALIIPVSALRRGLESADRE